MFSYEYARPALTTDSIVFGFDGSELKILLIERGIEPYKGCWALPGGFVKIEETVEVGAKRELAEETGLKNIYLEQIQVFSDIDRDPRERVVTVAFLGIVKLEEVQAGDDASKAQWFGLDEIPSLAFDHEKILRVAQIKLKEKIHFQPIGFELLPSVFTMPELQNLYEAILGVRFDRRNFAKKINKLKLVTCVDDPNVKRPSRYARKYRFDEEQYKLLKQKGFRLEF